MIPLPDILGDCRLPGHVCVAEGDREVQLVGTKQNGRVNIFLVGSATVKLTAVDAELFVGLEKVGEFTLTGQYVYQLLSWNGSWYLAVETV